MGRWHEPQPAPTTLQEQVGKIRTPSPLPPVESSDWPELTVLDCPSGGAGSLGPRERWIPLWRACLVWLRQCTFLRCWKSWESASEYGSFLYIAPWILALSLLITTITSYLLLPFAPDSILALPCTAPVQYNGAPSSECVEARIDLQPMTDCQRRMTRLDRLQRLQ